MREQPSDVPPPSLGGFLAQPACSALSYAWSTLHATTATEQKRVAVLSAVAALPPSSLPSAVVCFALNCVDGRGRSPESPFPSSSDPSSPTTTSSYRDHIGEVADIISLAADALSKHGARVAHTVVKCNVAQAISFLLASLASSRGRCAPQLCSALRELLCIVAEVAPPVKLTVATKEASRAFASAVAGTSRGSSGGESGTKGRKGSSKTDDGASGTGEFASSRNLAVDLVWNLASWLAAPCGSTAGGSSRGCDNARSARAAVAIIGGLQAIWLPRTDVVTAVLKCCAAVMTRPTAVIGDAFLHAAAVPAIVADVLALYTAVVSSRAKDALAQLPPGALEGQAGTRPFDEAAGWLSIDTLPSGVGASDSPVAAAASGSASSSPVSGSGSAVFGTPTKPPPATSSSATRVAEDPAKDMVRGFRALLALEEAFHAYGSAEGSAPTLASRVASFFRRNEAAHAGSDDQLAALRALSAACARHSYVDARHARYVAYRLIALAQAAAAERTGSTSKGAAPTATSSSSTAFLTAPSERLLGWRAADRWTRWRCSLPTLLYPWRRNWTWAPR
jgi:hypothetical protein